MIRPSLFVLLLFFPLSQCDIQMGTFSSGPPPWFMHKDECYRRLTKEDCIGSRRWVGYAKDIIELLSRELGYESWQYILRRQGGVDNGTWKYLINDVVTDYVDVAVAPLVITQERMAVVDFTYFLSGGFTMVMRRTEKGERFLPLNPYAPVTWWTLLILQIVSFTITVALFTRFHQADTYAKRQNRFWTWLLSLSVWLFFSIIMSTAIYTHVRQVMLINSRIVPVKYLDTIEDVVNDETVQIGMLADDYDLLKSLASTPLQKKIVERAERYPDILGAQHSNNGFNHVRNENLTYAYIVDDGYFQWENMMKPCNTVRKIGNEFVLPYDFGVATKKGSGLTKKVAAAVEKIKKNGELDELYPKWFIENKDWRQCPVEKEEEVPVSAAEEQAPFSIIGLVLSIVISVIVSIVGAHLEKKKVHRGTKYNDEAIPMNT